MDSVVLAYVHDVEVAYSFDDSKTNLLLYDASREGRVIAGGYLACRYGTGGIVGARNKVARQFLDTGKDWLFWVDTDMGFAEDTVEKLLEVADPATRPIVGGLCFAQKEVAEDGMSGARCAPRVTIMDWIEVDGVYKFVGRAHYPVNSLVQCAGTGSACLLVHRSVFEKIAAGEGVGEWYDPIHTDEGPIGEDLSFCARAGAAGFPIFVHTGVKTTHLKNTWVGEPDYWSALQVPPATERTAVIVPVLNRPQNAAPFMASLRASTGVADVYAIASNREDCDAWKAAGANASWDPERVTFAEKVNDALVWEPIYEGDHKWVFLVGDDVRFHPGWLDHAQYAAELYNADVVGTNDLGNPRVTAGDHATHMLIRRSYIDEVGASWDGPGVVCHEGYRHWYVDDEIVTAAKQRDVWSMALGSIVEHLHPAWKKGDVDDTYKLGARHADDDRRLFERRLTEHSL